jgi:hypothetical protein
MNTDKKEIRVTEWFDPNGKTFPSQYGHVTFSQWCMLEVKRTAGRLQVVEHPDAKGFIALARAK